MRKETIEQCCHEARTSVGLVGIVVAYRFFKFSKRGKSCILMCYSSRKNGCRQPRCRGNRSPEPHWHFFPAIESNRLAAILRATGSRVYLAAKFGRPWPCRCGVLVESQVVGCFRRGPKGTLRGINSNLRLLFSSLFPYHFLSTSTLVCDFCPSRFHCHSLLRVYYCTVSRSFQIPYCHPTIPISRTIGPFAHRYFNKTDLAVPDLINPKQL